MSDTRAGWVVASSFAAGLACAAAIYLPRAWDPIPEPYFGLDEPPADRAPAGGASDDAATPIPPDGDQAAPVAAASASEPGPRPAPTPPPARAPVEPQLAIEDREALAERLARAEQAKQADRLAQAERLALARSETAAAAAATAQAIASQPPAPQPIVAAPLEIASTEAAPPESLRELVVRVQAPSPPPLHRAEALPAAAPIPIVVTPVAAPASPEPLGSAPLPGDEWVDPDRVNWSEVPLVQPAPKPATVPVPRFGLRARLRGSDRVIGRERGAPEARGDAQLPPRDSPADIRAWPSPHRLLQQLEQIGAAAPPSTAQAWATGAAARLRAVLATQGPGDRAADAALVQLGESVHEGIGIADATSDHDQASTTRRASLAIARRVAVWRAAAGMCAPDPAPDGPSHDALARARIELEVARLLDALERFEASTSPVDGAVAAAAVERLEAAGHPPAARIAGAVRDHYLSANVRIAVHQDFVAKMLPETTVTTDPVDDVVLGRKVRGTRTLERSTTLRFTPDSDEICFDLEVHGEVASRTVTDSGPVSLTSRGESSFTVRKPVKIGPQGLVFGAATGIASSRSQLANVQTSFDSVPIMRSLVRNIARNQHEESLPEANREVIDHIVARACREVDAQAEPRFAELSERIRERIWMPLARLGLGPTAVALETTPSVATVRLRLAAPGQLAAHTPRPRAPGDSSLSLQVHESTVNNALERLGLGGRRLSLEAIVRLLYERLGLEPRIPDDLPEGVEVTFAAIQPLRVECRDGLVHVRVALDAIESGRRNWYDIVAKVSYRPVADAPQVYLEREGPVQLSGPNHQGRIEFALRTIFSKIFPKERPIALLPERLSKNPQLAGMQVLQAVSTDGWFAVATGLRGPGDAVAQPAGPPTHAADKRRRILLR